MSDHDAVSVRWLRDQWEFTRSRAVEDAERNAPKKTGRKREDEVWGQPCSEANSWIQLSPNGSAPSGRYRLPGAYSETADAFFVFGGRDSGGATERSFAVSVESESFFFVLFIITLHSYCYCYC